MFSLFAEPSKMHFSDVIHGAEIVDIVEYPDTALVAAALPSVKHLASLPPHHAFQALDYK